MPFTNFGTVKFVDAYATTPKGDMITPDGADVIILQKNNIDITKVTEGFRQSEITYIA